MAAPAVLILDDAGFDDGRSPLLLMIVVFASCNTLRLVLLSTKLMLRRPQETSGDSVDEPSRISDGDDRGSRSRLHRGAMG